ncbi:alpha-(1-_3)-arabinofuranosyltransferase domain-containing protein [Nocardioides panacisoli]|uniref:Alpha-(1->3)-arabinofuranosyltransferase n=1 Tax=Nocardioides panacisoli TaxID=627624 RepID=A0ABP7IMH4_9ACTN
MSNEREGARRAGVVVGAVYACLTLLVLTDQPGHATSDTRLEMTEDPGGYLAGTFSLWHSQVSLGELQNQAYGYLFPQGAWFALWDWVGVPGWVSQRVWSALVLVLACEGVRRLARALGIGPWASAVAGLSYGLAPRMVEELGVRSAEILPGAIVPWALLPILAAIDGRRRPRDAAVLSAAVFACSGGVNGTATAAPVALLAVVVLWAVLRRHLSWRFAVGWAALIAAVSAWWVFSLLKLGAYSPPFFDYVEDARTTTDTSGFSATLRGASNWVGYIVVGDARWWPAGYEVSVNPWLVLASGVVAALGIVGLLRYRGAFRAPLLWAAGLGIVCQVLAHTGTLDGPLNQWFQDLLDGPLAPLRNVPKADPILRVPLAIGVGVVAHDLGRVLAAGVPRLRRIAAGGLAAVLVGGVVAMSAPIAAAETRTPGWDELPDYWTQAADYAATHSHGTTWVIPGSGFAIQRWGWTMEEPMQAVARSPWVTRSQVPLTPAGTIRMLSALEAYVESGAGSPYLSQMLARIGVDTVIVRHDLDQQVSQATPSDVVSVALARSPGIEREASFGQLELGPAIEVFSVQGSGRAGKQGYDVRDTADAVTVGSDVEDAVGAVGAGLVGPGQPIVLAGTPGWDRGADLLGDGYRRRERAFGRIHDAVSNVMARHDPYHAGRVLPDYPGAPGARPVVARYRGIAGVDASTSRGWADALGEIRPEDAPWSALDGDSSTYWRPAPFQDATKQWLDVDLGETRAIGAVEIDQPVAVVGVDLVRKWAVTAGGTTREVAPDPVTGRAEVDLGGVEADHVRVSVASVGSPEATIGITELRIAGVHPHRTLRLPHVTQARAPDLVFGAQEEARACVTTLLGPDCDPYRQRASEEAAGIDRTFFLEHRGSYSVSGLAVPRARAGTAELLRPQGGVSASGSSWLGEDPEVSPRMAYDGDRTTSWIADPRDPRPTLRLDLGRVRTIDRVDVLAPGANAVGPDGVVVSARSGGRRVVRHVSLDGYGAMPPVTARRLTLRFTGDPGDGRSLGVGELRLGGARIAVPIDGAAPTGAVCGFGPTLVVDGRRYPTRVRGSIGAVIAAGQLAVGPCGRTPHRLDLGPGRHRVRLLSTEQFGPVAMVLRSGGDPASRAVERSRSLEIRSTSGTRVVLDVGPGQTAIVSAPFNENEGWEASVDGRRLEPITVDGWAQGFVIPAGVSGTVVLTFGPQRSYLVGLIVGLVLLGLVLLWGLWVWCGQPLWRRWARRTQPPAQTLPAQSVVPRSSPPRGLVRQVLVAGVAVVLGLLVGGPIVGVAAGAGVLVGRWRTTVPLVVLAGLMVALGMLVVALTKEAAKPSDAVDLVTGAALALGFGAAWWGPAGEEP